MTDVNRTALAEELLQEAVYRSRGAQAGAALFAGSASCGLGEKPAVVLDLTPRAEKVYEALFPDGLSEQSLTAVREEIGAWVRKQDGLDRRRNHFLKDFRGAHGFDRSGYDDETRVQFEAGLEKINREALEARAAAAESLLARADGP